MDLRAMAVDVHRANANWWINLETGEPLKRNTGELLFLVVTELAEACEGHRKNLMDDKLPHRRMAEVELADCLIRLLDIAGGFKLDLAWYATPLASKENFAENLLLINRDVLMIQYGFQHQASNCGSMVSVAIHRIVSVADAFGYDIEGAYREKLAYNREREDHKLEHRRSEHGKKY